MWAMFWWASATDCLIREEVDKAFFRQVVEASYVQALFLMGDFSTLLCAGRASQQIYHKYCVVII